MRNERVSVKEYGLAVGVTRRMIEDSRFSEMELALNEARRAVQRHITKHFIYAVFGLADTTFGTTAIVAGTNETDIETFATYPYGGFFGASPSSGNRLNEYGGYSLSDLNSLGTHYFASTDSSSSESSTGGNLELTDVTKAIELMSSKGQNPDTILVSPTHYKTLLELADFTAPFGSTNSSKGGIDYVNDVSNDGVVGQLYGLNVVVNSYVPKTRAGIFDMSVKPVAYVERRGLTVEEANPGFGIMGSYMSMRYGLKVIRPEAGCIVISD